MFGFFRWTDTVCSRRLHIFMCVSTSSVWVNNTAFCGESTFFLAALLMNTGLFPPFAYRIALPSTFLYKVWVYSTALDFFKRPIILQLALFAQLYSMLISFGQVIFAAAEQPNGPTQQFIQCSCYFRSSLLHTMLHTPPCTQLVGLSASGLWPWRCLAPKALVAK